MNIFSASFPLSLHVFTSSPVLPTLQIISSGNVKNTISDNLYYHQHFSCNIKTSRIPIKRWKLLYFILSYVDRSTAAISLKPYSSVYLFQIHRHKNCMLTTKIGVRNLHWYFRALWTLLFISRVHNQMLKYTTEFWLDKFYIWVHKWSFLLKWRFVYTVALTAWFLYTSESLR